jgi:hypothetical protein
MNLKNLQLVHVLLVLAGLFAACMPHVTAIVQAVEAAFPGSASVLSPVASALSFVALLVSQFTPSAAAKDDGKPSGGSGAGKAAAACGVLASLALTLAGCSWFQSHEALFPSPTQTACVLGEVENGQKDVLTIMTTCGIDKTLENDVAALIDGAVSAKKARLAKQADAGAEAGK